MFRALAIVGVCLSVGACSGSSASPTASTPAAPPAANLVLLANATLSVPGCAPIVTINLSLNQGTTTCLQFTGLMQNTGAGCATNVRGTTSTFTTAGQAIGSAGWSYATIVRPGEQFAYSGGVLNVATNGQWVFTTTAAWDTVACS